MSHTDTSRATALLEAHNPVTQLGLVSDDELRAARIRIERVITDAATTAVAGGGTERDGATASPGPRRRRRPVSRLVAAGLAAAAGAAAVAVIAGSGSATQTAAARTIFGALRALQAPRGSILHFDVTGVSHTKGGRTYTWRQDVWNELDSPWQQLVVDQHLNHTPAGTAQTYNELYDPRTNTVFRLAVSDGAPQVHITAHQRATMTRSELRALARADRSVNRSSRHSWMSGYIDELKAQLGSGRAHVDGRATVDGRQTIKITFRGSAYVDFVDPRTDVPVEVNTSDFGDGTTTYLFHTFEYLRAATHAAVFNLVRAHPAARIDSNVHDYRSAYDRLFPR